MKTIWANDLFLKIISIFLAVIVWLYIIIIQNPEIEQDFKDVSVNIIDHNLFKEAGLSLVSNKALSVDIKVKGTRKTVSVLNKKSIFASIDLAGISKAGEYTLPININLPDASMTVIDKKPYMVNIKLDRNIEIKKPISLNFSGALKEPFVNLDAVINPNEIQIKGPETVLSNIDKAAILIDLSNQTSDIVQNAKIKLLDGRGNEIASSNAIKSQDFVSVTVPVMFSKTVPIKTDFISENTSNSKVIIEPQSIKIASYNPLDAINEINIGHIDYAKLLENKTLEIPLYLQDGIISLDKLKFIKIKVE